MSRYIDADKIDFRLPYFTDENGDVLVSLRTVKRCIDMTPTADVMAKIKGKWIKRGNEKKCSKCQFIYYSNNDEWTFCPNCGAKMKGGD